MKKYISSLCIGFSLFSLTSPALAYSDKSGNSTQLTTADYDVNDPFTWSQSVAPFTGSFGPHALSYRLASCMIHAAAFTQVKLGVKPIGYSPFDLYQELERINGYEYGYADYSKIDWGGDWEMVPGVDGPGKQYQAGGYQEAVKAWSEGYMVVLRVNSPAGTHQIAIDHITEDGKMIVFDSGFKGSDFSEVYKPSDVLDLVLFKSKSGTKSSDLPVLHNHRNGSALYAKLDDPSGPAKTHVQLEEEIRQKTKAESKEKSQQNVLNAKKNFEKQELDRLKTRLKK